MVIYAPDGTPVISVKVDDSSYLFEEIMGDASVILEFALTDHVELEPGSYVLLRGAKYELLNRADVSIQHTRDYQYKATFSGPQARFGRYIVYNALDGRLQFDMIGKPKDHLDLILGNLQIREPGVWTYGDYVDKPEGLVSYNNMSIKDALTAIAEAFDTEWSVEALNGGYAINLCKQEFNKDNPLALGYGKNQGFKPGVGRINFGEFGQVERVWIVGGERNLSVGEYGYTTLHFPKGLTFNCDKNGKLQYTINGTTYTENGFDSASALGFVTDEWGASVKLASAAANCNEAPLDLSQYYPKREGTVSDVRYLYKGQYMTYAELIAAHPALTDDDWLEIQVDICDSSIPANLNYAECCLSADEPMTVIFQTGELMGREFSAAFVKAPITRVVDGQTVTVKPGNRFELVRTTIDGVDMPNATFRPNAGAEADKYIVVNVYMPEQYICDFAGFEGAEIEALKEACKFIFDNKDPQFSFKGQVDDLFVKRNRDAVGPKLKLGGCISFQDSQIQPTPIVTRIVGIKTYINSPDCPELTLSNETVKGGMASLLAQLRAEDEHVVQRVKEARRFTQRSFRDAKETISMLAGALDYFSEGINPITVETMSLLVGDQSLQFNFFTNRSCTTPVIVSDSIYDPDTHKVSIPACVIKHFTLKIDDIKPSDARDNDEYLRWTMDAYESAPLTGTDELGHDRSAQAYYIYAKVDAENVAKPDSQRTAEELTHIVGEFLVTTQKHSLGPTSGSSGSYYYLLVGILNSEYEGGRSFAPMYGFTEVLPGQITTDVIRSSNGQSFFDLSNNQFALGDSLSFLNSVLTLRGALVVSGSGDTAAIGAWCGQWNVPAGRQYANGDEVWWTDANGLTSTYRYINENPSYASASNDPSHTAYWQVIAQGAKGDSPLTADLTNEADGFAVGSNGVLDVQLPLTTGVKIRVGETDQTITAITPSVPSAFSSKIHLTPDLSTGAIAVVIDANTDFNSVRQVDIPIVVACAAGSRTVTYSLIPVKDGEDGAVYKLVPDTDVVKGTLQNGQTTYIPSTVSVSTMAREGSGEMQTANFGYIFYSTDGGTTLQAYSSAVQASAGASAGRIIFYWYLNQNKTVLLDRETVPVILDGSVGARGVSTAVVFLYKRASTAPSVDWSNALTYSFVTNQLTSNAPSGWYKKISDIPASDDPLYVTAATAASTGDTDDIAANEWASPVILAENGTDGLNTATVMLYKRASSTPSGTAAKPSGTTRYTFATGVLSVQSGSLQSWQQTIPSGSDPCYVIQATAIASGAYDDIANTEWSSPVKLVENGAEGNGIDRMEDAWAGPVPNGTTPPADSDFGSTRPTPASGQYIWTRTTTYYTDPNKTPHKQYTAEYCPSNGAAGATGPMLVNRGTYDKNESNEYDLDQNGNVIHQTYYGTAERRDVVYWPGTGQYFMANPGVGEFGGIPPVGDASSSAYWSAFAVSLPNIATGLVLASEAVIEKAIVRMLQTANTGQRVQVEGNDLVMYDSSGNEKMRVTGDDLSSTHQSTTQTFPAYKYAINYSATYSPSSQVIINQPSPQADGQSVTFSCYDGAVLKVPSMDVYIEAFFVNASSMSGNNHYAMLQFGFMLDEQIIYMDHLEGAFGQYSLYQRTILDGFSRRLNAGTHRFGFFGTARIGGGEGGDLRVYVYNPTAYTLQVVYQDQKTEIAANGFQVRYTSEQMFRVVKSGSSFEMLMKADNAGLKVLSNGTNGYVQILIGSTWYYIYKDSNNFLKISTTAPS